MTRNTELLKKWDSFVISPLLRRNCPIAVQMNPQGRRKSYRTGMLRPDKQPNPTKNFDRETLPEQKAIGVWSLHHKLLSHPKLKLMTLQQMIYRKQLISHLLAFKKYSSVFDLKARHLLGG